jgi:hypothetical protein
LTGSHAPYTTDAKRGKGTNQDIDTTPPALCNLRQVIGEFAFLDNGKANSIRLDQPRVVKSMHKAHLR